MRRASSRFIRPAPLAGSLLLILAPAATAHADDSVTSTPAANATSMTITVRNCRDSGPGSLRAAVASALSGDTIDMTDLACFQITIRSPIMIPQDDLTLVGDGIRVDGNRQSSVFRHSGTGTLRIEGMTIARGRQLGNTQSLGGCLYSAGNIELSHALVHWCHADRGGGLYAVGAVTVTNSQVLGNTAPRSYGGGIYAGGHLIARHSYICGNHSYRGGGAWSGQGLEARHTTFSNNTGGALEARDGDSVIANSTISNNTGPHITVFLDNQYAPGGSAVIVNSTISGNISRVVRYGVSGPIVVIRGGTKSIVNSTIAFNRYCGLNRGAVSVTGPSVHIESAILANNSCDGSYDITGYNELEQVVIEGADNLITSSDDRVVLPPDTISADPRLAPLASNGGQTRTHALLDDSPAIDMGNNAADLAYDQRGTGFPRVKGPQADIGAYER